VVALMLLGLLVFFAGVIVHIAVAYDGRTILRTSGVIHQTTVNGRSLLYLSEPLYSVYRLAMPIGSILAFVAWGLQGFVNNFMKIRR
jgi:hypothetical protein